MLVSLSFDDNCLAQFKWSRGLFYYKIPGTFFVNPATIDTESGLKLWMLKKMHDEWGHTIANHMYDHKGARMLSLPETLESIDKTDKWLVENGFEDGVGLLALPYGSVGGRWNEYLPEMIKHTKAIRDVGSGVNKIGSKILNALGDKVNDMLNVLTQYQELELCLFYFHDDFRTSDSSFLTLLERLHDLEVAGHIELKSFSSIVV